MAESGTNLCPFDLSSDGSLTAPANDVAHADHLIIHLQVYPP